MNLSFKTTFRPFNQFWHQLQIQVFLGTASTTSSAHLDLGGLSHSLWRILSSSVILDEKCLWTAIFRPLWGCFTGFKFEPLKDSLSLVPKLFGSGHCHAEKWTITPVSGHVQVLLCLRRDNMSVMFSGVLLRGWSFPSIQTLRLCWIGWFQTSVSQLMRRLCFWKRSKLIHALPQNFIPGFILIQMFCHEFYFYKSIFYQFVVLKLSETW